ncbi:MarR family winged helix-turn-helix transcriptional regulator [Streptomyces sp. NPDC006872]|uniref:MarR family winged helix-turn-helix transcriptional regulator n=1 Tax=Streptomyces sp. NPDC006872 TaxID=3155720 RepID=UPI0033C619A3
MTTTAPPADSRLIGRAHYASRAVLEHFLARHGATFLQQLTLRATVLADGPLELDALVEQIAGSLKNDPADVHRTVDELLAKGLLVADGTLVGPTDAGRELIAAVLAETGGITARIYAGIPPEDLAAAGRVLVHVTERAEAELAVLDGQP